MIAESEYIRFLGEQANADSAHDLNHVRRVVSSAGRLARIEVANPAVVIPAAWLHDCVLIPKHSAERKNASSLAAEAAIEFLATRHYDPIHFEGIHHAIVAHSYSAQIPCQTIEARVVQDADRIDALGAIGIARCFAIGGMLGSDFYQAADPFCENRAADDQQYVLDHFYEKLFKLPGTMQTEAGRAEARDRVEFMRRFLEQFRREIDLEC